MADDAGIDIDDVRSELAVVAPTEFTATRNARAKALRAAKERERAALVAKLPKPTWTAWALNLLARWDPAAITAWLQAGDALDAALGAGDRDALRAAQQDERAALAATIDRAHDVLTEAGRSADDQTAQKLTGTLRAAVTDAGVRDRLVRGVLDDDVEAPTFGFGFGAPADAADPGVVSLDAARAKRAASASGRRTKADGRSVAHAATETETATDTAADEAEARALAKAEAQAREQAEAERVAAERLEAERSRRADELRSLEADLASRTAEADAAEDALRTATASAEAAWKAVEDVRAAVATAQAALDELGEA